MTLARRLVGDIARALAALTDDGLFGDIRALRSRARAST
jgi:hypothetical protein